MGALLYHEKQVASLCGVHCLNMLLQGPIFSEVDLAQIAQELDALEKQLLGDEMPDGEHGNVDNSGMFSIQVLSKALEVWGLTAIPITSPEMRGVAEEPQKEQAFILNLSEHWFTLRRMGGDQWYNFNSLYPAPEALGTFHLAAFLASMRQQGYTVFVIRGQLPRPQAPSHPGPAGPGRWFTADEAQALTADAAQARHRGKVMNTVEDLLSAAQKTGGTMTLRSKRAHPGPAAGSGAQGSQGDGFGGEGDDDDDEDLRAAIAASLGVEAGPSTSRGTSHAAQQRRLEQPSPSQQGQLGVGSVVQQAGGGDSAATGGFQGGVSGGEYDDMEEGGGEYEDEDPELAAAIAASLEDAAARGGAGQGGGGGGQPVEALEEEEMLEQEPEAGQGVVELAFRLPTGDRSTRRFNVSDPVSHIFRFLRVAHQLTRHLLVTQFPRRQIGPDAAGSLTDVGLAEKQVLSVELQR